MSNKICMSKKCKCVIFSRIIRALSAGYRTIIYGTSLLPEEHKNINIITKIIEIRNVIFGIQLWETLQTFYKSIIHISPANLDSQMMTSHVDR